MELRVCEAKMPQSQEQRGLFRGRDVGKVLNFLTTGHSVKTRRQCGRRTEKIHRNSSSGIPEIRYNNSRTIVKSSNSELSSIVRLKWYTKTWRITARTTIRMSWWETVLLQSLWSKLPIRNVRPWCHYFSSELLTIVQLFSIITFEPVEQSARFFEPF